MTPTPPRRRVTCLACRRAWASYAVDGAVVLCPRCGQRVRVEVRALSEWRRDDAKR